MKAYINYPNPHITIHGDDNCPDIRKQRKMNQRVLIVNIGDVEHVLQEFIGGNYKFSADSASNDMWLDISLTTFKHSESFVFIVHEILANRYKPFRNANIHFHSC